MASADLPGRRAHDAAERDDSMTMLPTPGEGCPPPLRSREVAATLEQSATAWSLPESPLGTHGWTWGTGPSLYFLSPIGGCARLFALASWLLREDFRCVLIDWDRPRTGRRLSVQAFIDDIETIANQHDDEQILLYGGDFGALLALQFAAQHPRRVDRALVQGISLQRQLSLAERCLAGWYARSAQTLAQIPYHQRVQTINHQRWFPPLDYDRWNWFLETTGQISVSLVAAQARAWHQADLSQTAANITCPVLFIHTEGMGPATQNQQERLAAQIADAHQTPLHTTGWHPYLTHPHRVAKLIRQFSADATAFDTVDEPEFFPLNHR